jgi:hypothetical protein
LEKEAPTDACARRIVFIHGPIEKIPLKPQSVDLVFDNWGTSSHNLERPGYLVDAVFDKLKPKSKWIAGHLYFESNSKSMLQIPKECQRYLLLENIKKSYTDRGFISLDTKEMCAIDEGGEWEPWLLKGDRF